MLTPSAMHVDQHLWLVSVDMRQAKTIYAQGDLGAQNAFGSTGVERIANRVQNVIFRSPFAQFPNVHLHCSQMSVWTVLKCKSVLVRGFGTIPNVSNTTKKIWSYACACFVIHGTSKTSKKHRITPRCHDLQCDEIGSQTCPESPPPCRGPRHI